MNNVISKISQVESAATAIMDDANIRKKALAEEFKEKTAAFDSHLEEQTAKTISDLRLKMEADMKAKLSEQKDSAANLIKQLETVYDSNHAAYAKQLFFQLVKE